jgi:release factor glutamine methyltransferase
VIEPAHVSQALVHLQQRGLSRLESQMLVLHALGREPGDRAWLLSHDQDRLAPDALGVLERLTRRRLQGEPMAYIVGHKDFHALRLKVDARVLDPRDDTETLVDWALALHLSAPARVLDLGTGSGAIALSLAQARPDWELNASDASADALCVAQHNAAQHGLTVNWVCGNWLAPFANERFDLIVSNPPYIPEHDPHLADLRHEPMMALASGPDGLRDLRAIIAQAPGHLNPGGWLLLEHGHDQAPEVRRLLGQAGFAQVSSRTDLSGIERCSGGCWSPARFCHP